ncbi:uncharacterized protein K444DRAFT_630261 [Hyaloscypha bicolor E]|uniref:Uncharacterized protein n=1 Tax=Hyaloscypha bicolor E TaxID=1095630 RepID=A0A2J6T8Z6_9HELO|nr:uncharacterized protein K444DRAFT_630261 [Hyaloscypha bicolor E]PMD59486.1 hypothetical protein K444DRAFT_630261 [Hyaloscypha bicolor E]
MIASSTEGLKAESPLFRVCWFRMVLDEDTASPLMSDSDAVHTIRSGSIKKLYQTAARLDKQIGRSRLSCLFLRIPQLDTAATFRKNVIQPLMKSTGAGSESLRLLLDSICLRRSRKLLDLPETNVNDRVLEFSEAREGAVPIR